MDWAGVRGVTVTAAESGRSGGGRGDRRRGAEIAPTLLSPPEAPAAAPATPPAPPPRAPVVAAFLGILALAALLRVWGLESAPPGLNHDEAVNGLDVRRIIAGWRPVFLPANNGREALFMYLQAAVGAVAGVSPVTLRLAAALTGIATVAATVGLGRRWYGARVGLLAGGLLAVAFWHVVLSRVGLRAIMAPLFFVLVFWALGAALRRHRPPRYALGGLLLGLAQYTYISARLLPPLLLLICPLLLWRAHRHGLPVARRLAGLALAALVAALTVLPEALYFLHHPEGLVGRTDQVLVFNSHPAIIGAPITFQESVRRTLGMFWVEGDANWLHNIAALPLLDPLLTPAFLLGAALVLAGLVRGREWLPEESGARLGAPLGREEARARQASPLPDEVPPGLSESGRGDMPSGAHPPFDLWPSLWLLAWFAALLAGSSVTQESPNYLRLTALMPAVAIVCALGLDAAAGALRRFARGRLPAALPVALLTALVLGEGARTARLYFGDWAGQGGVYTAFDTDIHDAAAASRAAAVPMADTLVQLDASAPFLFFRPESADARWLREYSTLVLLPPPGQPGLWVYSHVQSPPPLPDYLPQARLLAQGDAHPGHPGYFVYRLDAAALDAYRAGFTAPSQPLHFGDQLTLLGSRVGPASALRPGDSARLVLLWRVDKDATANFGVSVHLTDERGRTWAQADRQGMLRDGWHAGDLFVSRHDLTIPEETPAMPLAAEVGASVLDPLHQPAAVLASLGGPDRLTTLDVQPGMPGNAAPPPGARAVLPGLSLVDATVDSPRVKPGDTAALTLRWLRSASLGQVSAAVALLDARGKTVATAAGAPGYGRDALADLPAGRVVADPRSIPLPAALSAGSMQALLVVRDAGGAEMARLPLGTIQVQDRAHRFSAPPPQFPLRADFGGSIALLGYDLPQVTASPGGALAVTFTWQAVATPSRDYTVFVHLLDADGKIAAQNDSQPAQGTLPTRSWLPHEVVRDSHRIDLPASLPPGTYRLEIGWYDGATGARLALVSGSTDHLDLPTAATVR